MIPIKQGFYGASMSIEDFDPGKDTRKAAEKRNWDHTIDQVDEVGTDGQGTNTTKAGYLKQSHAGPSDTQIVRKKTEKERDFLLKESLRIQLAAADRLAELDRELEEIRQGREAIQDLKEGLQDGTFNPDDPAWKAKMEAAGVSEQDMSAANVLDILSEKDSEFAKRQKEAQQERDFIKQRHAEIQASDLPEEVKDQQMKEVLEQASSEGSHAVWKYENVNGNLQEGTASVNTQKDSGLHTEEQDTSLMALFGGISVAKYDGIGEGITSENGDLNLGASFTKAVNPPAPSLEPELVVSEPAPVASNAPALPGLKPG